MARLARGQEVLTKAQELLITATKAHELRILQSVIFPLVNGMSTIETATAIGRSPRWVTKVRNEFIRNAAIVKKNSNKIRNKAYLSTDEEKAFLSSFFDSAKSGGLLEVSVIHKSLEHRLGRKVSLATVYNILHRNGWRKLVPDKRNTKTDVYAQEEWKKNFQPFSYR